MTEIDPGLPKPDKSVYHLMGMDCHTALPDTSEVVFSPKLTALSECLTHDARPSEIGKSFPRILSA